MSEAPPTFAGTARFQVRRKLGEGGMGVVYEAYDSERHAVVALKTLSRVSPAGIYRLKKEFRALAALEHPNLVRLHELVHLDGRWLFTMDLVDGVDFVAYVRGQADGAGMPTAAAGGWLDVEEAPPVEAKAGFDEARLRHALKQLAACLRALHETGRVHRDLKPSNVLVKPSGDVAVLDFGLVHRVDDDAYASLESAIVGTPAFMAPEQASGEPITAATDWYALGVMLYQALTGVLPFGGSVTQLLTSKQVAEPPHPSTVVGELPEDLASLCADLLKRRGAERPGGDEVLRRLGRSSEEMDEPEADENAQTLRLPAARRRKLIGRDAELAALSQAVGDAPLGGPVVVELVGPPGAGRTALLRAFLAQLGGDALVLAGRCHEREEVPYKAFDAVVDALARYLRHLPDEEARGIVPEDVGALARIFPVLGRVPVVAARATDAEVPDMHAFRRHAFAALAGLFSAVARQRGVVAVIDDLHWGDADSAALLAEVLRQPGAGLLFVLSYRATESESPLLSLIRSARWRQGLAARWVALPLEPLSVDFGRQLAESLMGTKNAAADAIARDAGGNPLLIVELARAAASAGGHAAGLEALIERRIRRLGAEERALLDILAYAAAPLSTDVATRAAGLQGSGGRTMGDLARKHLLLRSWHRDTITLHVLDDRVREVVLRLSAAEDRPRAHARLAYSLDFAGAAPELVAHHLEHAGEKGPAAQLMLRAAEVAMRGLAFHRAAELFGRAARLLDTEDGEHGAVLVQLGDALAAAGRSVEAARAYLAAADRARSGAATGREAFDLQRLAGWHLLRSGHIDEGIEALRAVLAEVGLELPASPRRALMSVVYQRTRLRLRGLVRELPDPETAMASPREPTDKERRTMDACWAVAVGLSMADTIVGADFHARFLSLALASGDPARICRALAMEAAHVGSTGHERHERAAELLERAEALAHGLGDPRAIALTRLMRAGGALFATRWPDALAASDEAATIFRSRCVDVAWEVATSRRFSHTALFYLGEFRELAARVPAAMAEARACGDRFGESCAGSGSAIVGWLASGQADAARAFLEEEPRHWGTSRFALQHYLALQGLTLVDLHAGRGAEARERLLRVWPRMKSSQLLRVQLLRVTMLTLRAQASLAAATSPAQLAAAERDARAVAREGLPTFQAFAALLHAGIAARGGKDTAPALYHEAIDQLKAAGMRLHASAARHRLGELVGGDEGKALRADAKAALVAQHVQHPEAMFAMLAARHAD